MGSTYSVADAYLFTVVGWAKFVQLDLSAWPHLIAFQGRVAARPATQRALKAEGRRPDLIGARLRPPAHAAGSGALGEAGLRPSTWPEVTPIDT